MLTEMMSYSHFLFWYSFIMVWFFLAAIAIYFVVIKDGLAARKVKWAEKQAPELSSAINQEIV